MDILARLIDQFALELESLESLIELSKSADIGVHKDYIAIYHIVQHVHSNMSELADHREHTGGWVV